MTRRSGKESIIAKQEEREIEIRDVSKWYEQCIEYLLRKSGLAVKREPRIGGKTPDLL